MRRRCFIRLRKYRDTACSLRIALSLMFLFGSFSAVAGEVEDLGYGHLRLNQIQYIGTHNSYHSEPDQAIDWVMLSNEYGRGTNWPADRLVIALSYDHYPLSVQLELGMRTFELDLHDDVSGGRYSEPGVHRSVSAAGLILDDPYDPYDDLEKPGFKVFHMQDIDVRSSCLRFVDCLEEMERWSSANPAHLPIIVQIEAKYGQRKAVDDAYDPVVAPAFDAETWGRVESEILSVFERDRIISPSDVRGTSHTLNAAATTHRWPTLDKLAGKIMFIVIHEGKSTDTYLSGGAPLGDQLMFVNVGLRADNSTFTQYPKPQKDKDYSAIRRAVKAGYFVYTRADAGTLEARDNDTRRQQRAFASGAQLISTDFPYPNVALSAYRTQFPGGVFVRCNPMTAKTQCEQGDSE